MIRYALVCSYQHEFESWFSDSAAFDRLSAAGEITCPECGCSHVRKALMAPAISKGTKDAAPAPALPGPENMPALAEQVAKLPPKVRAKLEEFRKEIESTHDYVGDQFAEEARAMHFGETEERGIYGDATREQAEELIEEGIDVALLPFLPRLDA